MPSPPTGTNGCWDRKGAASLYPARTAGPGGAGRVRLDQRGRYADYGSRDMALRADAGRYECGTLNTVGCFGLKASLEFLLEVGTRKSRRGAGSQRPYRRRSRGKGYEVMGGRTPETASAS